MSENLEEIAALIAPVAAQHNIYCGNHPETESVVTCAKCGCGLCSECWLKVRNPVEIVCPVCQVKITAGKSFIGTLKMMRFPVVWVVICIVAAGVAFALGVGNPDIKEIARRDKKYSWFVWTSGKLYLDQASREKQRAAVLRRKNQEKRAAAWSLLAAKSFAKTAEFWRKTPVYYDLKIAQAIMLFDAGKKKSAIDLMSSIDNIKSDYPAYIQYKYQFAIIADKCGWKKSAEQYLHETLKAIGPVHHMGAFDDLIKKLTGNRKEAEMIMKVNIICGTDFSPKEIRQKCNEMLGIKEHDPWSDIEYKIPKSIKSKKQEIKKKKEDDFVIEHLE